MVKSLKQVSQTPLRRGQRAGHRWPAAGGRCIPRGPDGSGKCHAFIFPHRPAVQGHRATEPQSRWSVPGSCVLGLPCVSGVLHNNSTLSKWAPYLPYGRLYRDFTSFPLTAFFFPRSQSRISHAFSHHLRALIFHLGQFLVFPCFA